VAVTHQVEVRRSRRRTRTVSAWREGGRIVVAIPASFSAAEERRWVDTMAARVLDRSRAPSDPELARRADQLADRYLGGVRARSVSWSSRQQRRWGSCTSVDGTIRVSTRLRGMPDWVLDYVLVHELAHLQHADHGTEFWQLVQAYPLAERARGFLAGVDHGVDPDLDPDQADGGSSSRMSAST
jgi:predicted metal-dependent hydrolase